MSTVLIAAVVSTPAVSASPDLDDDSYVTVNRDAHPTRSYHTRYPSHLSRDSRQPPDPRAMSARRTSHVDPGTATTSAHNYPVLNKKGPTTPIGRRRGASRTYESLEDLLTAAGYKETRIFTPENERVDRSGTGTVRTSASGLFFKKARLLSGASSKGGKDSMDEGENQDEGKDDVKSGHGLVDFLMGWIPSGSVSVGRAKGAELGRTKSVSSGTLSRSSRHAASPGTTQSEDEGVSSSPFSTPLARKSERAHASSTPHNPPGLQRKLHSGPVGTPPLTVQPRSTVPTSTSTSTSSKSTVRPGVIRHTHSTPHLSRSASSQNEEGWLGNLVKGVVWSSDVAHPQTTAVEHLQVPGRSSSGTRKDPRRSKSSTSMSRRHRLHASRHGHLTMFPVSSTTRPALPLLQTDLVTCRSTLGTSNTVGMSASTSDGSLNSISGSMLAPNSESSANSPLTLSPSVNRRASMEIGWIFEYVREKHAAPSSSTSSSSLSKPGQNDTHKPRQFSSTSMISMDDGDVDPPNLESILSSYQATKRQEVDRLAVPSIHINDSDYEDPFGDPEARGSFAAPRDPVAQRQRSIRSLRALLVPRPQRPHPRSPQPQDDYFGIPPTNSSSSAHHMLGENPIVVVATPRTSEMGLPGRAVWLDGPEWDGAVVKRRGRRSTGKLAGKQRAGIPWFGGEDEYLNMRRGESSDSG